MTVADLHLHKNGAGLAMDMQGFVFGSEIDSVEIRTCKCIVTLFFYVSRVSSQPQKTNNVKDNAMETTSLRVSEYTLYNFPKYKFCPKSNS